MAKVRASPTSRSSGSPACRSSTCTIDRAKAARAGLNVSDIQQAVEVGSRRRRRDDCSSRPTGKFDVAVRLERPSREHSRADPRDPRARSRRLAQLPIGEVADVRIESGAAQIKREANSRRIAIKCGIHGRDLGSFVREARRPSRASATSRSDRPRRAPVSTASGDYRIVVGGRVREPAARHEAPRDHRAHVRPVDLRAPVLDLRLAPHGRRSSWRRSRSPSWAASSASGTWRST